MTPYELTAVISTLAIIIAESIADDDELTLLALSLTQLGDTLGTIVTQRGLLNK